MSQSAPPPPPPALLPSLHGMRFVAALLVFAFHGAIEFVFADETVGNAFIWASSGAAAAVSFFFVLSGFVLTWSRRPGERVRTFWRRRFLRILPNHLVTFCIAVALLVLAGESLGLPQTLSNLFLVQTWFPDNSFLESANGVSWSLSVDVAYYLSFPVIIVLVNKVRPDRLWGWVLGFIGLVVLMPTLSLTLLPSTPQWSWGGSASWVQIWFAYVFPPVRLLEMVIGMLLARIVMTGRWIRLPLGAAVALVVVGYLAVLLGPWSFLYNYAATMIVPIALLIPAAAVADIAGRRTLVGGRTLRWLGDLTFAFYLVHDLVLSGGHRLFGVQPGPYGGVTGPQWSTPVAIAFLVAALGVSILLSWALFRLVERPVMRRFSGRTAPGPAPAPAPVAATPGGP